MIIDASFGKKTICQVPERLIPEYKVLQCFIISLNSDMNR